MMREKLWLLSRFPLSPPNPRVSGGLPLLLGGSLHHHGGSPLPCGGLSPHLRLGLVAVTHLFMHSRSQNSIKTHPHHTPKPISSLLIPHPPITPPTLLPSDALPYRRHLRRPDLVPQTLCAAIQYLHTTLSPPTHDSVLLFLTGTRSTVGAPLQTPSTTSVSAPPRPPPKPPPPKRDRELQVSFPDRLLSVLRLVLPPFLRVVPIRPPPKPPWPQYDFLASQVWVFDYGVSMGSWFQVLGMCFSWFNYAQKVFVVNPHRALGCLSTQLWMLLLYMMIVKTFGGDTLAGDRTSFQFALKYHDMWVNLETISSRIERTQVKDIIRNWIERKTVESLPLISTSTWELKPLLVWLFRCCVWVAYVLMDLKHSKCIGLNAHSSCVVVFINVVASSLWYGNVQPNLLHVILLMILSSFD